MARTRSFPRRRRSLAPLIGAGFSLACSPEVVVGDWPCAADTDVSGTPAGRGVPDGTVDPIAAPWSAGFENGFCDYGRVAGFCYADESASFELVRSPVRSGNFAAAFTLASDATGGAQVRCVREGVLPRAAYYGAWYYIPAFLENTGNWNLFHFQGGAPSALHGLWDVSVRSTPDGELFLQLFDFFAGTSRVAEGSPPVPLAAWFHIEMYFERAADMTGRIELYQDGELLLTLADLTTDDTDWGQWYVGNLADALMPPESTVYVDDVTIRTTR